MADQQIPLQEEGGPAVEDSPEMQEEYGDQQDLQNQDEQPNNYGNNGELYQEDAPEENYTGSLATALADQRISRKKASEDVKILANRIALLKAEEQKAWKKIEETKKKAQDILEIRQRNNEKNTTKAYGSQNKFNSIVEQTEKNNQLRQQRNDNILRNTQSVLQTAQQEALRLKHERQQHEKMITLQKDTEKMHNTQMKQMIREQKMDSQAQREHEKDMKKEAQRMELIERITAENTRRQEIEMQVAQLESQEAEWIKKLQHTNQLQGVACGEYENALTNDIEQLQQIGQKRVGALKN